MNDQEMMRAYAAALRRRPREGAAPPLDDVLALVERRGGEEERLATLDAVMADPAALREFELLRALAANRPRQAAAWRRTWGPARFGAIAAALFMLAATPLAWRAMHRPPEPVRDATPGATLLAPAPTATAAAARHFRWHAVPGTHDYAFELLAPSGTPLLTSRTTDTTLVLPDDVRLTPGVEYRWWIIASLSDGTELRSTLRPLTVLPPP